MHRAPYSTIPPLIATGILTQRSLLDQIVVVTGVGHGLGFETARSLAWLGARLVVVDSESVPGRDSAVQINQEFRPDSAIFVQADHSDEKSIVHLARQIFRKFGRVDAVINTAAALTVGSIKDTLVRDWDLNYRVNLRGPVLMSRVFLPAMLQQDCGVFVFLPAPSQANNRIYDCFKKAQVKLATDLDAEIEESGVISLIFNPGRINSTAERQPGCLLDPMGFEPEVTLHSAGAGCAAAVALAPRFRGLEVNTHQALEAAGIHLAQKDTGTSLANWQAATETCEKVRGALLQQASMWSARPQLERQWILRDFKRSVGIGADECLDRLTSLKKYLHEDRLPFLKSYQRLSGRLATYFTQSARMAAGGDHDNFSHGASAEQLSVWAAEANCLALHLKEGE